jgi:hypothetical protein
LRAQASGASDNTLRLWRVSPRAGWGGHHPPPPHLCFVWRVTHGLRQNCGWGLQGGAEMAAEMTAPPAARRVQEPKKQSEYGGALLRSHHQHVHSTSALA